MHLTSSACRAAQGERQKVPGVQSPASPLQAFHVECHEDDRKLLNPCLPPSWSDKACRQTTDSSPFLPILLLSIPDSFPASHLARAHTHTPCPPPATAASTFGEELPPGPSTTQAAAGPLTCAAWERGKSPSCSFNAKQEAVARRQGSSERRYC